MAVFTIFEKPNSQTLIPKVVTGFAVLWAAFGVMVNTKYLLEGHWNALGVLTYYLLLMTLFVIRKPSRDVCKGIKHRIVALMGSWLPLFMMPTATTVPGIEFVAVPLQTVAFVYLMVAILSLSRSFGVFAAYREIKTGGLYRWVRHPLYSSELLGFVAVLLVNLSWYNVTLLAVQLYFQLLRIRDEENLLSQDPTYVEYRSRVRYRLIPGLY
jgi:protein-S-isoprenylcysteine O-methyltransferase Ste14